MIYAGPVLPPRVSVLCCRCDVVIRCLKLCWLVLLERSVNVVRAGETAIKLATNLSYPNEWEVACTECESEKRGRVGRESAEGCGKESARSGARAKGRESEREGNNTK